jgi:hypothetical protein
MYRNGMDRRGSNQLAWFAFSQIPISIQLTLEESRYIHRQLLNGCCIGKFGIVYV